MALELPVPTALTVPDVAGLAILQVRVSPSPSDACKVRLKAVGVAVFGHDYSFVDPVSADESAHHCTGVNVDRNGGSIAVDFSIVGLISEAVAAVVVGRGCVDE